MGGLLLALGVLAVYWNLLDRTVDYIHGKLPDGKNKRVKARSNFESRFEKE